MKLFDIFDPIKKPFNDGPDLPVVKEIPASSPSAVLSGLEKIKTQYDDSVSVQAKEYAESQVVAPDLETDDELLEKAKASIEGKYSDKIAKTEQRTQEEIEALIEKKKDSITDYSDKLRDLERSSASAERRMTEAFAKNDMTHSSAFELRKKQLEEDYIYDRTKLEAEKTSEIESLDRRIAALEQAYKNALSSFEIEYAIELEDKKTALIEKRDRLLQTFENSKENKLGKAEEAFLKQYEKENKAFEEEFKDYKDDKKANYEERLRFAVEETNKLSKREKNELLNANADALKEYLGLYFDRYLKEIKGG